MEDALYNVQFNNETNGSNNNEMKKEIQKQKMNVIIQIDNNKADLAKFLHGTLFSPEILTLKKSHSQQPSPDMVRNRKTKLHKTSHR